MYYALNAVMIKICSQVTRELGDATMFTKVDLPSGYHQFQVIPADTHKTLRICVTTMSL